MPGQPRKGSYASMPTDTAEQRYNKTRNELGSDDADKQANSDKGGPQFFNPALQSRLLKQMQDDADALAAKTPGSYGSLGHEDAPPTK